MERPKTQTFLLFSTAASIAICTRDTLDANVARMIRPLTSWKASLSDLETTASDKVYPGFWAFVESAQRTKHTVAAKLGELVHIRLFSVHRGMIKFKITCMHHSSYRRTDINAAGSGME